LNGLGYTSLNGGAHEQTHVGNVNLMATPVKNLTIVPSCGWSRTTGMQIPAASERRHRHPAFQRQWQREKLDVRERLDVRYTGVTNWVFSVGGEWTEGSGNLYQTNGLTR